MSRILISPLTLKLLFWSFSGKQFHRTNQHLHESMQIQLYVPQMHIHFTGLLTSVRNSTLLFYQYQYSLIIFIFSRTLYYAHTHTHMLTVYLMDNIIRVYLQSSLYIAQVMMLLPMEFNTSSFIICMYTLYFRNTLYYNTSFLCSLCAIARTYFKRVNRVVCFMLLLSSL